jgi:hypothetical protein
MTVRREKKVDDTTSRRPPATTPEARENQLISLAMDLTERRMREGTASAQEVTHFLKLGSSRERLEQDRLKNENSLTLTKITQIESQASIETLYRDALSAMSAYQGNEPAPEADDYED